MSDQSPSIDTLKDFSATPPASKVQNGLASAKDGKGNSHTRTYQACIPCRNRKVRCDLGEVDNPHPPPCKRCQRESKQCYFSATRRKRKAPGDDGDAADVPEDDDYESRNGRKRSLRAGSVFESGYNLPAAADAPVMDYSHPDGRPRTPGGSIGRSEPLRRPTNASQPQIVDAEDQKVNTETAAILQTGEIFSGHDALNLLYEAAGRNGDIEHHRAGSSSSSNLPRPSGMFRNNSIPTSQPSFDGSHMNGFQETRNNQGNLNSNLDGLVNASLQQSGASLSDNEKLQVAIKAWSKLRFVRAGWFTAKEGIAYINHFYEFLSPLTPVVVPNYQDPLKHASLLRDEPLLAVTILTIAARHMPLDSPGGASRAYAIHDTLWKYLQGMINRLVWGQEQFGGGFCGAGAESGSDVNPFTRKGLRTLGTIESLLLITEWHPRALHFPPRDDGDELVATDDAVFLGDDTESGKAAGGRMDAWLEPCWRSDRICWMLLGNAMTLGFEIGVFDDKSDEDYRQSHPNISHDHVQQYIRRKNHIRELLVVYATQTSGRLGLTSMMPKMEGDRAILKAPNLQIYSSSPIQMRSPPVSRLDMRSPLAIPTPPSIPALQSPQDIQDTVIHHWIEIAKLGELGNKLLFPSRAHTRDLIRTGKYAQMLDSFKPRMEAWRRQFDSCTAIPAVMRHILTIEYEYSRVYINSLALQAVFHRCAANSPLQANLDAFPSSKADGGAIPFTTLTKWICNDRKYIEEVIQASRTVLEIVIKHLFPVYLRHCPVRAFFRIVSVAIILLKTFALGATESDVAISLGLLDNASRVLSMSIIDDVHVGNRFAELLRTLTARIRGCFVRMAGSGGAAGSTSNTSRAASRSPLLVHAPNPQGHAFQGHSGQSTPMMPPPNHPNLQTIQPSWPTFPNMMGNATPGFGNLSGQVTPNQFTFANIPSDPLQGISTEAYDPESRNISIMPPPNFAQMMGHGHFGGAGANSGNLSGQFTDGVTSPGGNSHDSGQMADWLALPLDNLLNSYGADVSQTTYGPDVGGIDLLDVLLNSMEGTA